MARITSTILTGLPVVSESGTRLGHVRHFEVEVESHVIVSYTTKPHGLAAIIGKNDLVIHPAQVVAITETQMTVRDTAIPVSATDRGRVSALKKDPLPALSSERAD